MPRINALNILLESDGKEYLAELYGKTIDFYYFLNCVVCFT